MENEQDAPPALLQRVAETAFVTVAELSTLLRVNHKTVRDAIARGEIPGVLRIGGTIRIHRDTVMSWFTSGQGAGSR